MKSSASFPDAECGTGKGSQSNFSRVYRSCITSPSLSAQIPLLLPPPSPPPPPAPPDSAPINLYGLPPLRHHWLATRKNGNRDAARPLAPHPVSSHGPPSPDDIPQPSLIAHVRSTGRFFCFIFHQQIADFGTSRYEDACLEAWSRRL